MINRTLIGFLKKEFRQALRDPRMKILLFGMPMIQMTLFGVALSNEVKNIRLAVVAPPNDTFIEKVYEKSVTGDWFVPAKVTQQDPFAIIQSGEADAVLVAPPGGLTRAMERREGDLQLLINASNVVRAQAVERYVQNIVASTQAEISKTPVPPLPLRLEMRILYNPSLRTAVFMVPGVMSMVVCVLTILLTSMSLTKEKEQGTFETLIAAPVKPWEVILGKALPFVVLGMVNIPLILSVAVFAFKVPMRGPLWTVLISAFMFVCTTVSIGLLISTIAKTQQQSMMGGLIFTFPAVLLSGMMFPVDNMPAALKVLAYLDPITFFIAILRNVMLKGGDPWILWTHNGALFLMALITVTLSFRRFKTHIS